jgi:hypothetical protein
MMLSIIPNPDLIGYCGLYCGACRKYLNEKCPGCRKNETATWCKVRTCGIAHQYASCADCMEIAEVMDCKKFNNFISKIFGFLFGSDRNACIQLIKKEGYDAFARRMAENKTQTIKK